MQEYKETDELITLGKAITEGGVKGTRLHRRKSNYQNKTGYKQC